MPESARRAQALQRNADASTLTQQQGSPFRYRLKPKAGGIALVFDAMGEQLSALINMTVHYPAEKPTFWNLLSGQVKKIVGRFEKMPIPAQFIGQNPDQRRIPAGVPAMGQPIVGTEGGPARRTAPQLPNLMAG